MPKWDCWYGSELFTVVMEVHVYACRYALLAVPARNDDDDSKTV